MYYGTLEEKKALAAKSGWWAAGGLLIAFGFSFLFRLSPSSVRSSDVVQILFLLTRAVAGVSWVVGCCYYAKSKGWSPIMGCLTLIPCIGLIALVLLPDKWRKSLKDQVAPQVRSDLTNYPRA